METNPHRQAPASDRGAKVTLSFGLVTVPIQMCPTTVNDYKPVPARSMFTPAGNRVRSLAVDEVTGEEISRSECVKKTALGDEWIELTEDEIEEAVSDSELPKGMARIEAVMPSTLVLQHYVIDGWFFARAQKTKVGRKNERNPAAEKALALFLEALDAREEAALFRYATSRGQTWAALLPDGRVVTLAWAPAVRAEPEWERPAVTEKELDLAQSLLGTLRTDEAPVLVDEAGERVRAFVASKATGEVQEIRTAEAPEKSNVIDLAALLEASVAAATEAAATEAAGAAAAKATKTAKRTKKAS